MKSIVNISILVLITLFFSACGGGGSDNKEKNPYYERTYGQYNLVSEDNFKYAWHINENINSVYKSNFFIDDNAHINISPAWSLTKGKKINGEKIRVAIIDEDFEVNHPDLQGKIYKTYNVMNDSSNITATSSEKFSHGTAISGFVASDFLGVAPEVELILININLSESIEESYYLKAFDYAKKHGASVINCSWGGESLSQSLSVKLQEMYEANINVIFASGNGANGTGINLDSNINEESESTYVLSVGSTTVLNDRALYSNYGSNVDILAPGGGGKNYYAGASELLGILALDSMGTAGLNNTFGYASNNYTFTAGTSFSAPLVSGTIALMLAVNPNLTPAQIRNILLNTAQKVGENANYDANGFDKYRAYGKVDTGKAVEAAANAL